MRKGLKINQKLILCGNGGSGDSQHIAAELVSRLHLTEILYPPLTTDTSILTSIANDYTFDNVFSRQIEALGKERCFDRIFN